MQEQPDPPPDLPAVAASEPAGPAAQEDVELARGEEPPNSEDAFSFTQEHRVRYDEVDAQGIVGHGSWMQILQLGRVEYLRYLGLMMEGGRGSPVQAVVRRSLVDFLSPARFDDPLLVRVRCAQMGERSARIEYVVDNIDTGLRQLIGETTVVCIDLANFRSIPWPQVWRERVAELEQGNLQVGLSEIES